VYILSNYNVLFVDDEEELVSATVERLGYRGIEADYTIDGQDALKKLQSGSYDLIIVDLKMPGISGTELTQIIHETYPKLPIIMITGHGSSEKESFKCPDCVTAFLQKPIDINDLMKTMEKVIEEKRTDLAHD
jgi:DNA-binding NtrC family response regulator